MHRSLFLKTTGRFIIGFVSFLLFLISITGTILIVKRQGGFKKIFSKVVKEDFNQYYHIILGKWFLIPIAIITLTGIYLSLEKFSLLPKNKAIHEEITQNISSSKVKPTEFEIFKTTKLSDITALEFPFSSDEEDYFNITTVNKEFAVHQFNGAIITKKEQGLVSLGSYYLVFSFIIVLFCYLIFYYFWIFNDYKKEKI